MPQARPTVAELRNRARKRPKGNHFDAFVPDQVFAHHWGRTITETDNVLFSSLTMHYTPLYTNEVYAKAHGHDGMVINPYLVFLVVFGLSVEDLSEVGGAFLGVEDLTFHQPVRGQDTLTAKSRVVALRDSDSRPDCGIATWHTEGRRQDGTLVIDFRRTNMVTRSGVGQ